MPAIAVPFDVKKLDALMAAQGLDALIITSKHNIRYLLGGYQFFFFAYMDAIGTGRYVPALVYRRGQIDKTLYIGNPLENFEHQLGKFWPEHLKLDAWGSADMVRHSVDHFAATGGAKRIGVEMCFMPGDALDGLRTALPTTEMVDATILLERLRAIKTDAELELLRIGSEKVVESMLAVFANHGAGATKNDLNTALKHEESARGLTFEYCLMTAGTSHNRSPSDYRLQKGDVVTLDSGGNYHGYVGDLCRMGIVGEPDQELVDLLGTIDAVQQAARHVVRAGAIGGDIFTAGLGVMNALPHAGQMEFLAHGMGLITHEAPRLTSTGPVPYPADDADQPLEAGMMLSIETTLKHARGYIKLEDTVCVTATGSIGFGDAGRGWNRMPV